MQNLTSYPKPCNRFIVRSYIKLKIFRYPIPHNLSYNALKKQMGDTSFFLAEHTLRRFVHIFFDNSGAEHTFMRSEQNIHSGGLTQSHTNMDNTSKLPSTPYSKAKTADRPTDQCDLR